MDNPLDNDDPKAAAQSAPKPGASTGNEAQPIADTQPLAKTGPEPKRPKAAKPRKKRPHPALIALGVVAVLAAAAVGGILVFGKSLQPQVAAVQSGGTEAPAGPLAPYAKGSIAHLVTLAAPKDIDNMAFLNRDRKPVHLSDFKGQVVVLNLWATWCAPCRFEMPTLAKLQASYVNKGLKVIPLSGDGDEKFADVESFIDVQEPLEVYADPDLITKTAHLNISGLPATLILDKQGREVARLDGEATWDTPEVRALMDKLLSE